MIQLLQSGKRTMSKVQDSAPGAFSLDGDSFLSIERLSVDIGERSSSISRKRKIPYLPINFHKYRISSSKRYDLDSKMFNNLLLSLLIFWLSYQHTSEQILVRARESSLGHLAPVQRHCLRFKYEKNIYPSAYWPNLQPQRLNRNDPNLHRNLPRNHNQNRNQNLNKNLNRDPNLNLYLQALHRSLNQNRNRKLHLQLKEFNLDPRNRHLSATNRIRNQDWVVYLKLETPILVAQDRTPIPLRMKAILDKGVIHPELITLHEVVQAMIHLDPFHLMQVVIHPETVLLNQGIPLNKAARKIRH
ncbi:hypothetical protein BKA69DRAFT_72756 [Paraphysoderma sedebokerense]|nr:hypothetical protein BKA69DRAFT_72756 [Paraphysoderma sedebokerense]